MAIEMRPSLAAVHVARGSRRRFERVETVREPEPPPVPAFEPDLVDSNNRLVQ